MNLIQLVLKQMRQRALSTCLTLMSVMLGVALAIAVMIFQREGDRLFGQTDFGYDLIVGAKGSKLQLVLNTVYHIGDPPNTIPYSWYEQFPQNLPEEMRPLVKWKAPFLLGDMYQGHRVVATTTNVFGVDEEGKPLPPEKTFKYRRGKAFRVAEGQVFGAAKFEAVIGSEIPRLTGLKRGGTFKVEHGLAADNSPAEADVHDEQWTVVGVLSPTGTANDRVLFVPLISSLAIPKHAEAAGEIAGLKPASQPARDDHDGHDNSDRPTTAATAPAEDDHHDHAGHHHHEKPYHLSADGTICLHLPKDQWRVAAVAANVGGGVDSINVAWAINNAGDQAMAANPAIEMLTFFNTFFRTATMILLVISLLVTVVAAVSILVSIYNSVAARRREIAIVRALGATRMRVLAMICIEAALIGLVGGLLGLVLGHLAVAGISTAMRSIMGEGIEWVAVAGTELLYLGGVVIIAALAGLVPALKAYSTPVADNLVNA